MTSRRAFWEALATVCAPSLVIWGVLFYLLRPPEDEWIIFLIGFALPLPLFFPLYSRYRRGVKYGGDNRTPRQHLLLSIFCAVLSAAFIGDAFNRSGWDRAFHWTLAGAWLVLVASHFRNWMKQRATSRQNAIRM